MEEETKVSFNATPPEKIYSVLVVSDATGKTAYNVVRSILVQFKQMVDHFFITHYSFVRDSQKIEKVVSKAKENNSLVVHTVADSNLRNLLNQKLSEQDIIFIDIFQNILPIFTKFIGKIPSQDTGLQYKLTDEYFKKIEAMEFTLIHDDGQNLMDIDKADIILLGPSRASKTPLSIYLANEGYKVTNIPLVYGIPLPEEVFRVDPKKVIGLMLHYDIMVEIRKKRVSFLGEKASGYADPDYIFNELEYCRGIYKKNRQWKVIDVSKRAIEETAAEIIEKIMGREEVF